MRVQMCKPRGKERGSCCQVIISARSAPQGAVCRTEEGRGRRVFGSDLIGANAHRKTLEVVEC